MTSFVQEIITFLAKHSGLSKTDLHKFINQTPNLNVGDYAFGCFPLAKALKKKPNEIAKELAMKFSSAQFEKVEASGPYLNFFVKRSAYQAEMIQSVLHTKAPFGSSSLGKNQTVCLEYSSPNIAKPFHVGHFRATIIGNTLKNIYTHLGYKTTSINYLGDWGTQFGKLITAFKKWGEEKKLKSDPIKYLNSLYVKFHEEAEKDPTLEDAARNWFKKCENSDKEALALWKQFKDLSLSEFNTLYDKLSVTFDETASESQYNQALIQAVDLLKKQGLAQKSQGALIVDLEKYKLTPALLIKKDGSSLYMTRDIAALLDRYKRYQFHKMIYIVGMPQSLHFKQLFKVVELLGNAWTKNCHHVAFGHLKLKDKSMSTRKGTAILLEELLSKSIELISKTIEQKNPDLKNKQETAAHVGLGAIIFADFNSKRIKDVIFDWDVILNPEGDTGPYVHYTYARASSILRKVRLDTAQKIAELKSDEEQALFRALEKFPTTLQSAARDFEPSYLATYLIELSKQFNRFYHHHRVIQAAPDIQFSRAKLVEATRLVLKSGLNLLGIQVVEEL